ncbi:uncharacterized protein LOC133905969 [Phragmites australis]|uniref:uncharacterized protein LOC133905969 n=1 Tax=Phragmites australis TaxID=29695 RepID=UPI002D76A516|nr:uncharacterized protein LOC133905969 [Phragmites australis]
MEMCEKLGLTLMKHPHAYHVQWFSDCGDVKVQYLVRVIFSIHDYTDTVDCDVVPMTICHLLLGRPWQFDRGVLHEGRDNTYAFKCQGKGINLLPMTPNQIIAAANMQRKIEVKKISEDQHEKRKVTVIHKSVSEGHKTSLNGKRKSEKHKLVMIATKSEMKEVRDNPKMVHFVLLYKDAMLSTNDLTPLPSGISSVLQDFEDVFPEEIPAGLPPIRGIEHQINLIPGVSLPNRPS